ncbi:MAG: cytochrome P450 [Rubripirellula sp.]
MILRHSDVRSAAADWQTYSSDAPFRVPIPSEESVRTIRQLPIELDPPRHAIFRALTDPFFARPKRPEVIAAVREIIQRIVKKRANGRPFEANADLALPLQSRALTQLLNVPESEAEIWIGWGIHVFRSTDGDFKSGDVLEQYLNERFDLAMEHPGDDFFSILAHNNIEGRPLTRDECLGFANLAFAGGRDTIIHTLTRIIDYLGKHPESLEFIRADRSRITLASEEFFRVAMPLTQIGRVCPSGAEVHGMRVEPGQRVGLCWISANHDETVFDAPETIQLDRRPNPHVSFGFRHHLCQGAAHSRLLIRSFLETLCDQVDTIEIQSAVPARDVEAKFTRENGFERLVAVFHPTVSKL